MHNEQVPGEPPVGVLLVDNSATNRLALRLVLEDLGLDLVEAHGGDEALHLLEDRDFAVVLLDVQMNGPDGFETARVIRGRDRSRLRRTPCAFFHDHYFMTTCPPCQRRAD